MQSFARVNKRQQTVSSTFDRLGEKYTLN